MLSAAIMQKLRKKLEQYEGNIPYMYVDTNGHLTIGIGHLLATAADAEKLPFIVNKTGKPATKDEIKTDFDTVMQHKKKNVFASYYKTFTKLNLQSTDRYNIVDADINNSYKDLKHIYPDFDKYPTEVKLALFDLMFNQGMPKMRTKWPNFNKAVKAKNWKLAAQESHRARPFPTDRNNYVKDLFNKAATSSMTQRKP